MFLESFLLHFCALGTRITEPVERWIRRAAERCASMGLTALARALKGYALAEAGHPNDDSGREVAGCSMERSP